MELYLTPPSQPIALEELEEATTRRFDTLMSIDRGNLESIRIQDVDADILEHFGLRLILSAPEGQHDREAQDKSDLCTWFARYEAKLIRLRLINMIKESEDKIGIVVAVLQQLNSNYEIFNGKILVPFQDVPFLIRTRQVLLLRGICYIPIPSYECILILENLVQELFLAQMEVQSRACKVFPTAHGIEQLWSLQRNILNQLRSQLKNTPTQHPTELTRLKTNADLSKVRECLPLCMRYLYDKLDHMHHLKYDGRNQLRMFLKGVGFTFEENMIFWREAFAPKTSKEVFDKKYAYNVRHSYGLVGSRIHYESKGCDYIQSSPPGANQYHGCPFKHWENDFLRGQLILYGISPSEANFISRIKSPESACTRYLNTKFPSQSPVNDIRHPNIWFNIARRRRKAKNETSC